MSSQYGENLRVSIFGESHGRAVGVTVEGIPAGERVDLARLQAFLDRRAPGRSEYATPRRESDVPEILCGLRGGVTCGTPLTAILRNEDTRPQDYEASEHRFPRPGHADFTAGVKYGGAQDGRGGGHFSGRLTAPLCVAGGICLQLLERRGITVISRIASIADVGDEGELTDSTAPRPFPTVSEERGKAMLDVIARARAEGDSVGGVVECAVRGVPAGLGDPMFSGMENRIAQIVFGIPAVKGIEFGAGFGAARLRGSENNDAFALAPDGTVVTATNRCGGILGGITTGMPVVFRVAFKPAPTIGKPQQTVDLLEKKTVEMRFAGRHDPCIVPRAVPAVEAAAAIAVYDALLARRKEGRDAPWQD